MRKRIRAQLSIVHLEVNHPHAEELRAIGNILDANPECAELVYADLLKSGITPDKGREGMTGEQVLRAIIVKQMNGFSYEELAFHLADSRTYRAFCRYGIADNTPAKGTLQQNCKQVTAQTLETINQFVVLHAADLGVEKGRKVRTDCTVTETNIHEPSDSSLLFDCVRVLVRTMAQAKESFRVVFTNHQRRAKRRTLGILNAKTKKKRNELYRDLLKVTRNTVSAAKRIADELKGMAGGNGGMNSLLAAGLRQTIEELLPLARRVIDQTERRVLNGENVPAADKVISIFEPHTDIIIKDRRETLFGHKLCLTGGESGMILDCVVEDGNPADSTLAVEMVKRQEAIFGRPPRQVAFDGGFASKANLSAIKEAGVKDVAFSKRRGMAVTDMAKSTWVYRKLRDFRAGVEGMISFLKRCFGLRRCNWRGLASFKSYCWASVVSANLLLLARQTLE
jgi:IS5 family transposase